ncbi:MAG TPA: hypothetical protein VIJ22_02315 [Polyangiaceae bacterium]
MPTKKAKKKTAKKTAPARKAARKSPAKKAKRASKAPARKAKTARAARPVARAKGAKPAKKLAAKKLAPKKAPPKKLAAKTAAPKKPAAKKVRVAKPGVARAKPIQRRDHAGHIDPKYGAELLGKGTPQDDATDSFVNRPRSSDDLVEELGEEYVEGATSAEHPAEEALNQDVSEDVGGPFVESGGGTEFAPGTDASNPASATREPFPRS